MKEFAITDFLVDPIKIGCRKGHKYLLFGAVFCGCCSFNHREAVYLVDIFITLFEENFFGKFQ